MKNRIETLTWILLASVFISTFFTHVQLASIKTSLDKNGMTLPKVRVTDAYQFEKLAIQLKTQWNAEGVSIYLLQPRANMKTYKEKVLCTLDSIVEFPTKSKLTTYSYFERLQEEKHLVLDTSTIGRALTNAKCRGNKSIVVIPIYQTRVIIGEMYLQYHTSKLPTVSRLNSYVLEAQVLSQLLY